MKRLRRTQLALREAAAMFTQARYLGLDWAPTRHAAGHVHVILIHGLYASAGVFRPLRRRLHDELNVGTSSFSYLPGPGIVELTGRLTDLVRQAPEASRIVLVGHSLGGLVARFYVRQTQCDPRIIQTISLAAPFLGTHKYHLVPGQAGRDLKPGASILPPLCVDDATNRRVPHLTLVAADDHLIVSGAFPEYGQARVVAGAGHNGILYDAQAISLVVERVAACCASAR